MLYFDNIQHLRHAYDSIWIFGLCFVSLYIHTFVLVFGCGRVCNSRIGISYQTFIQAVLLMSIFDQRLSFWMLWNAGGGVEVL